MSKFKFKPTNKFGYQPTDGSPTPPPPPTSGSNVVAPEKTATIKLVNDNTIAILKSDSVVRSTSKTPKFGEWIDIKDKLPDLGKKKLVLCDGYNNPYISTAWLSSDGMWHVADPYALGLVTHWMELPQPPKGNK